MNAPRMVMMWLLVFALGQLMGSADAATRLPPVERVRLANGLTLLMVPNRANPYVELRFVARAGSAVDPAGKEGLAALTAHMLVNGTTTRGEDEIARELEGMGASLAASADLDSFEVGGTVVTLESTHLERFLMIFHDVLLNASFPEDSLKKTRTLRLAAIRRMADDHAALADAAFQAALYGEGPRGRMSDGTLRSVSALTRADLVGLRDRVLIPQHAVLAIGGDFDAAKMEAWVKDKLGDRGWGRGICTAGGRIGHCTRLCDRGSCLLNPLASSRYEDDRPGGGVRRGRTVLLVDRNDSTINQVQWRLGQDNPITLLDSSWAAFRLGTQILGGDFTARLNTVLRVREGLTYGARFPVSYGVHDSGSMRVATYVAPRDLRRALDLTLAEMDAVIRAPLSSDEVDGFRSKIINAFPFKFETVSDTLAQYLYLETAGVPTSWLELYTDRLGVPGPVDVHRAMQALVPRSMVLVVVGNRDLIPTLQGYGRVKVVSAEAFLQSGLEDMKDISSR